MIQTELILEPSSGLCGDGNGKGPHCVSRILSIWIVWSDSCLDNCYVLPWWWWKFSSQLFSGGSLLTKSLIHSNQETKLSADPVPEVSEVPACLFVMDRFRLMLLMGPGLWECEDHCLCCGPMPILAFQILLGKDIGAFSKIISSFLIEGLFLGLWRR